MQYKIFISYLCMLGLVFFSGCTGRSYFSTTPGHTNTAWHKATMKPYRVLGHCYHPLYVNTGEVQYGVSSWYGPNFHGKRTSNGEMYNMYARTAAHKTWPMDTMVKVTNLQNAKTTVVRINDRGPFVKGRIIDCSYTAGKELGLDKLGVAKVKLEVVHPSCNVPTKVRDVRYNKRVKTDILPLTKSENFGIQMASFTNDKSATEAKDRYRDQYRQYTPKIEKFSEQNGEILYKVLLMGFKSKQEAREFKSSNGLASAFIVGKQE